MFLFISLNFYDFSAKVIEKSKRMVLSFVRLLRDGEAFFLKTGNLSRACVITTTNRVNLFTLIYIFILFYLLVFKQPMLVLIQALLVFNSSIACFCFVRC